MRGGCGGRSRYGGCGSRLFNDDRLLCFGFYFNDGLFFHNSFLNLGLVVVKFPRKVCICGNDGFIFLNQLRHVVGIQFEGCRRFFLAQIFANQAASDQGFGIGKGILLLVVNFFDVDGRKSLLFASTLHKFQSKRELARRVDLIKERCLGIFLLCANIASAIDGILERGGFQCQIKIQGAGTDIDFCNLRMLVGIGVDGPTHTLLGAFIAHKCVADSAIILFGSRTRLHQFCLTALAIAGNNVTTRFFVEANNALVAKEITFVFVIVFFGIGFSFCFVLSFNLVLGIQLINLNHLILGIYQCGCFITVFLCGTCNSNFSLHAKLETELLEFVNRLQHFFGYRICTLIFGNGGGICFFDDLFGGLNDMLFNNRRLSGISRCPLGNNSTFDRMPRLNHRGARRFGNNSGFNSFGDCFNNFLFGGFAFKFFFRFVSKFFLGFDQTRDSL